MTSEFLTESQVAELAGVTASTIARWRRDGVMPGPCSRRPIRYLRADIERWLETGEVDGDSAAWRRAALGLAILHRHRAICAGATREDVEHRSGKDVATPAELVDAIIDLWRRADDRDMAEHSA